MALTHTSARAFSWRSTALGTASALALATVAQPALAQDAGSEEPAEEPATEGAEIIVSGFRAALQSAQTVKRNADALVDVITAEDDASNHVVGPLLDFLARNVQ